MKGPKQWLCYRQQDDTVHLIDEEGEAVWSGQLLRDAAAAMTSIGITVKQAAHTLKRFAGLEPRVWPEVARLCRIAWPQPVKARFYDWERDRLLTDRSRYWR